MGIHFQRGQALFDLDRYREAISEYLQELAENPESVLALTSLAAAYFNCRDLRQAHAAVSKAISVDPEFAQAYLVLSHIHESCGNFISAREAILQAIRLEKSPDYYHRLAEIYEWVQDPARVLDATACALELWPHFLPSLLLRGKTLTSLSRYKEADELLSLALETDPVRAVAHHALGALQLSKGDTQGALQLLKEARQLDPLGVNDKVRLAQAYGMNLPILRIVNRYVARWFRWPFRWRWLAGVILVVACCAEAQLGEESKLPNRQDRVGSAWWILCVVCANYLVLPYTLSEVARTVGMFIAKRDLDIAWHKVMSHSSVVWSVAFIHGIMTFVGSLCGVAPEFAAFLVSTSLFSPFARIVVSNTYEPPVILFNLLCCAALIALAAIAIYLVTVADKPIGYPLLLAYFGLTFFTDKIARWSSILPDVHLDS